MKTGEDLKIGSVRASRNWGVILCALPAFIVLIMGVVFVYIPEALLPEFLFLGTPFRLLGWAVIMCSPFVFRFLYTHLER